jgi:serine/threonine protein kinase
MLTANSNISHYRIISKIGAGGMGEVYLAHDTRLNRRVALKVLPADLINDRERLHRFEQEAQAASALNHPNIITIHEIGADGDTHYLAIEFIEGETLRRRLQTTRLEIRETLNIATQIAAALDTAHRSGIVHRDIKPENIMLREDGLVKVLDFGLAKLTQKKDGAPFDSQAPTLAQVETMPFVMCFALEAVRILCSCVSAGNSGFVGMLERSNSAVKSCSCLSALRSISKSFAV